MKIPTIDETIKRPTTAINQPKVNLNTRLTPLNNQLMYNKLYPEKDNLYNKGSSYQNVLINNRKLTRYSSRRHPSISPEGEGIYPILSLEKVSQQHPYTETSTSLDPVSLNAENLQSNGKHFSINGVKNSTVSLPKSSNTTTKRKITVKRNTCMSKRNKIIELIQTKTKITLKCFCILILLFIPIIIFIIMIIYSSSLEFDRPRDLSKNLPK